MDSITLKNNIPIIGYHSVELLSKRERNISKFFKCCVKQVTETEKKCFWSGNNIQKFKHHIQSRHRYVFCCYCLSDNMSNTGPEKTVDFFAVEDADQLIQHMTESHGQRVFQCNRCVYRAVTTNHIQWHQILSHYNIWIKNNKSLDFEHLDDPDLDICKVIQCKTITNVIREDFKTLIPKYCPDLSRELSEDLNYCLYCEFCNEEEVEVFKHCVIKHPNFEITIYRMDDLNAYSVDKLNQTNGQTVEDSDYDSDEPIIEETSKNLTQNFESVLKFRSDSVIPGIDGTFRPAVNSRPPQRNRFQRNRGNNGFQRHRRPQEFNNNQRQHQNDNKGLKRKDSYDSPFEDEINNYYAQNELSNDGVDEDISIPSTPIPNTNLHQNLTQTPNKQTNKRKKQKTQLKPNEHKSELNYGEYRKIKELKDAFNQISGPVLTSTPLPSTSSGQQSSHEMPPEIDLGSNEKELETNGFRKNKFKNINRIGVPTDRANKPQAVSYVVREEEEFNEYISEVGKRKSKRGPKPFQNYDPKDCVALNASAVNEKNVYKCILCPDVKIRENAINIHLKSFHKTNSSLKCGFCDYIESKNEIEKHRKIAHPSLELKIEKFIVPLHQNSSIAFTSSPSPKTTAKKSTGGVAKGSKGSLTDKIRDSTFMGPLRNDVTDRKLTESQQCQRVRNRSAHSSDIRHRKNRLILESDLESEDESNDVTSDNDFDVQMDSEVETTQQIRVIPKSKTVSVAKKSTAKPSSQNTSQISIVLNDDEIPGEYFCVFCDSSIAELPEAIEHYKSHLKLGYNCVECGFFNVSYELMDDHFKVEHNSRQTNVNDNTTDIMRQWILSFLERQIKNADFAENIVPNSTGIDIVCSVCVKAAKVCNDSVRARSFDSLWKVKLHICRHLGWMPMKCNLCKDSNILFPQNPYLLMKHLVDCHFTSCKNLHNISFRGQKPFNDMKREQMRLIDRNFTSTDVYSSDIINSFFNQMMFELDLKYENQLKVKFNLTKEIQIKIKPLVQIKSEPIELMDTEDNQTENKPKVKDEDEKKDIKPLIKSEVKNEYKTEVKDEIKNELLEIEDNDDISQLGNQFISRLCGEPTQPDPIASTSGLKSTTAPKIIEFIDLSSDEDEC